MISSLSVAIATHNEAENIKNCLDSINKLADEIIIYDGQSTTTKPLLMPKNIKKVKIISGPNHPLFTLINKRLSMPVPPIGYSNLTLTSSYPQI